MGFGDKNQVILEGNIAGEIKFIEKEGRPMAFFTIATTNVWSEGKSAGVQNKTYHSVSCFGTVAQQINGKYEKGSRINIEGRLTSYKKTNDAGFKYDVSSVVIDNFKDAEFVPRPPKEEPFESPEPEGDLPY